MLDSDEWAELRSLQARAYGRDAVLTPTEAVRLRALEDRRFDRGVESVQQGPAEIGDAPAAEMLSAQSRAATERDDAAAGAAPADAETDAEADIGGRRTGTDAAASPRRSVLRAHWRPVAIATVALLVIGLGIGWLAFGRSGVSPVALTAEQQQWQNDLTVAGLYDSGSIRALAVEEGVVIWAATKDEQARTCLILRAEGVTQPSCDRTEVVAETGIYGGITVRAAGDQHRQLSVQMLLTAAGDPAVAISTYDYDPGVSGITYANEEESQAAERLIAEGFDGNSLWVVGYDGDVPVWTAVQTDSQHPCLIYDGSTPETPIICADPETMQDQTSSLVLNVVDSATGAVTHLELASNRGPAYLVITREGGVAGAGGD